MTTKKLLELSNGNLVIINNERYAYNKCFITFKIMQKNGNWISEHTENYSIDYYNSPTNFILSNF